jgi:oxepin-CoA hydrolase/3-oxo-5,6-dehydrosuberyl-CoA semialdehyde dehydrogenase
MIVLRFDVNDGSLREAFLDRLLMDAVATLGAHEPPRWGAMSAQHMLEHLRWAFACSTGTLEVPCSIPPRVLERARRFLYDNRPTPHEFKNPLLGDDPPPLQYAGMQEARSALGEEIAAFVRESRDHPDTVRTHPLFGPLAMDEWQRVHFKHGVHHLLQFGLVGEPVS